MNNQTMNNETMYNQPMNNDNEEGWTQVTYKKTAKPKPKPKPIKTDKKNKNQNQNRKQYQDQKQKQRQRQRQPRRQSKRFKNETREMFEEECIEVTKAMTTLSPEELKKIQGKFLCECCCSQDISKLLGRIYVCSGCYCCEGDDVSYDMYEYTRYIYPDGSMDTVFGKKLPV